MSETFWFFIENIAIFKILYDALNIVIGTELCFNALKWHKGLLTATAIVWGAVLGLLLGSKIFNGDVKMLLVVIAGAFIFPYLTYTVPGVNRFVLGFIVATKISGMVTTVMMKNGSLSIGSSLLFPILIGILVGVILMAWTQVKISAFVLACAFLGASQAAPSIAKYINQILFAITGNPKYLPDTYDFIFALFKIELTDTWTLIVLLVLMSFGVYHQFQSVIGQGFDINTPVITYETELKSEHGKIHTN